MKLFILALVLTPVLAIMVTFATGQICQTSRCATHEPVVVEGESFTHDVYGWPLACVSR